MSKVADFFRTQSITLPGQQRKQMLALDREFSEMESKIQVLEAQNLKLQAKVNPLERDIERLKDQLENEKARVASEAEKNHLDELEIKIVAFLASIPFRASLEHVSAAIGISRIRTEVKLTKLEETDFVNKAVTWDQKPPSYGLTDKGKEFAVTHELAK